MKLFSWKKKLTSVVDSPKENSQRTENRKIKHTRKNKPRFSTDKIYFPDPQLTGFKRTKTLQYYYKTSLDVCILQGSIFSVYSSWGLDFKTLLQ